MHPFRPTPAVRPFNLPIWAKKLIARTAATLATVLALGGLVTAAVSGLANTGCNGQPVLPVVTDVVSIVASDLAQGKTDAQIASDVCSALGGSQTTDAICANVEVLIQDAITLLIDAGVIKAPGRKVPQDVVDKAKAYRLRHPLPPAANDNAALKAPPQAVGQ